VINQEYDRVQDHETENRDETRRVLETELTKPVVLDWLWIKPRILRRGIGIHHVLHTSQNLLRKIVGKYEYLAEKGDVKKTVC
jgi:hypothetical protein